MSESGTETAARPVRLRPRAARLRNRCRELRRARGLTLVQVAAALDSYPMTIARIERGLRQGRPDLRLGLARFYGVAERDLFFFEVEEAPIEESA